jgi:hypothetical protein
MDSLEALRAFFGWCTAINFGLLLIAALAIIALRGSIASIHGRMFGLDEKELAHQYFQYLARYKSAIFMFNLVPYAALWVMS